MIEYDGVDQTYLIACLHVWGEPGGDSGEIRPDKTRGARRTVVIQRGHTALERHPYCCEIRASLDELLPPPCDQ